ncbi:MAG TPA: hypothetical protein VJU84_19390 [Pyrinomonadaceae bacterium]|nr:hypothetical protein [Pyrinomonadaceae bacterium]
MLARNCHGELQEAGQAPGGGSTRQEAGAGARMQEQDVVLFT